MWRNALFAGFALLFCCSTVQAGLYPDPAFGVAGSVDVTMPPLSSGSRALVSVLPDRRIAVAALAFGSSQAPLPATLELARLMPDGRPDASFGSGGRASIALLPRPMDYGGIDEVKLLADGGLLVLAWTRWTEPAMSPPHYYPRLLIRVTPDGRADPAFNGGQPRLITYGAFEALKILASDDGILLFGRSAENCCTSPIESGSHAWRLLADGTPDESFGSGGSLEVAASGTVSGDAMAVPGGGFQVLHLGRNGVARNFWRRYRADGSLDAAFGNSGDEDIPVNVGVALTSVRDLGDGSYLGMAGGSCPQRLLDTQGRTQQLFGQSLCLGGTAGTNGKAQRYGERILLSGEQRFGGTPPPTDGTYLYVIDRNGVRDPAFAEPQTDQWRPSEAPTASYDPAADGATRVVLVRRLFDGVRVLRYVDVRGVDPFAQTVPALGLPALLLAVLGLGLLARRRFAHA